MTLSTAEIELAYRAILGRPPENAAVVAADQQRFTGLGGLRAHLLRSKAFETVYWTLRARDQDDSRPPLQDFAAERLVFLHIMKAAGTTLSRLIEKNFDKIEVAGSFRGNDFARTPGSLLMPYRFFHGHFTLHESQFIPGPKRVFTVLRAPRARILSLYRFHRALATTGQPDRHPLAHKALLPLKDYLADPAVRANRSFNNTQTYTLFDLSPEIIRQFAIRLTPLQDPLTVLPADVIVEVAKENLRRLHAFGVVEQFDDFLEMLFAANGLHLPTQYRPRNITQQLGKKSVKPDPGPAPEPPDAEVEALLAGLVNQDEALYAFAIQVYAERLAQFRAEGGAALRTPERVRQRLAQRRHAAE